MEVQEDSHSPKRPVLSAAFFFLPFNISLLLLFSAKDPKQHKIWLMKRILSKALLLSSGQAPLSHWLPPQQHIVLSSLRFCWQSHRTRFKSSPSLIGKNPHVPSLPGPPLAYSHTLLAQLWFPSISPLKLALQQRPGLLQEAGVLH